MIHKSWMLKQDGRYWEVDVPLYIDDDDDMLSAADASLFLLYTNSVDTWLYEYIIDVWEAMIINDHLTFDATNEDIDNLILQQTIGYNTYGIDIVEIHDRLQNYTDTISLRMFLNQARESLSMICFQLQRSLDQQFCRVNLVDSEYYTQYYTDDNDIVICPSSKYKIEFKIASAGYDWSSLIYDFVSSNVDKLDLDSISICREYEYGAFESQLDQYYYYTDSEGCPYCDMDIHEYLETKYNNVDSVFSSKVFKKDEDIKHKAKDMFANGSTYMQVINYLDQNDIVCDEDMFSVILDDEILEHCIDASYISEQPTRTQMRLKKVLNQIVSTFPEIKSADIAEVESTENNAGNSIASDCIFEIESDDDRLNHLQIDVLLIRGIRDTTADALFRGFRTEYEAYKKYKGIE